MNIYEILNPQAIRVPLKATNKKEAIDELIDLVHELGLVEDVETLKSAVWEREQQRSTGIGEGLAIPHGKSACIEKLVMAIGLPGQPIDFEAADRKPVRMIVLLASPPDKTSDHIQALGKISRLMNSIEFRDAAYNTTSAEKLYRMFEDAEKTASVS